MLKSWLGTVVRPIQQAQRCMMSQGLWRLFIHCKMNRTTIKIMVHCRYRNIGAMKDFNRFVDSVAFCLQPWPSSNVCDFKATWNKFRLRIYWGRVQKIWKICRPIHARKWPELIILSCACEETSAVPIKGDDHTDMVNMKSHILNVGAAAVWITFATLFWQSYELHTSQQEVLELARKAHEGRAGAELVAQLRPTADVRQDAIVDLQQRVAVHDRLLQSLIGRERKLNLLLRDYFPCTHAKNYNMG